MKLNLTKVALTAGISIAVISGAAVAEAGLELNNTSLKSRSSKQLQPLQQLKKLSGNALSLT